jgi:hypothetical protein
VLEEQPRPTGGARPSDRGRELEFSKGTESHRELAEQEERPRCRDRGLAVLEEQPRPTEACDARGSRDGESQEAEMPRGCRDSHRRRLESRFGARRSRDAEGMPR